MSENSFGLGRRMRARNDRAVLRINAQNALKGCPVYVDRIRVWPTRIRCFQGGSCHLFIEPPSVGTALNRGHFDGLHSVARYLGLRSEWFQDDPHKIECRPDEIRGMPHYDLTVGKRTEAVVLGVVELSDFEMLKRMRGWDEFFESQKGKSL